MLRAVIVVGVMKDKSGNSTSGANLAVSAKSGYYSPDVRIPTLHIQEINLFSIFKNQ